MIRSKTLFIMIFVCVFLVSSTIFVSGFQGSSSSYSSDNKIDSFSEDNANSTSFSQRLIGGIQTVGQYVTNSFGGRFGILTSSQQSLIINITSDQDLDEVVRGNDAVQGEDDKGYVPNVINVTAKVYDNSTAAGFSGANCYFYDQGTLIANSSTNSSGDCIVNWTKSSLSVGFRNLSVNYSIATSDSIVIAVSEVNVSLIRYVTTLTMANLRTSGCASGVSSCYHNGDNASLYMIISKINSSGTSRYDPQNISANATNAAETLYTNGDFMYPGNAARNITRLGLGNYTVNVTVNQSFGSQVRWDVLITDNDFVDFISTAVHADAAICSGDFGSWSDWSACSSGVQTRSRTDSTLCTEVETQSCTSGTTTGGSTGGGGSTGQTCTPSWGPWSSWGSCVGTEEQRTRSDGCGNTETEVRPCGCEPNWQCTSWSVCAPGNTQGLSLSADFVPVFEPAVVSGPMSEFKFEEITDQKIIGGFFQQQATSVCEIGETQCHPTNPRTIQQCVKEKRFKLLGSIVTKWIKKEQCATGLICTGGGECSCSPQNACDFEGSGRCTATGTYQVCQKNAQGCLKWGANQKCVKGSVCSDGTCIVGKPKEANVCEIGERTCIGNRPKICEVNTKGINGWVNQNVCVSGETCIQGTCVVNHCFNNLQDSNELGLDCGGDCNICPEPESVCGDGKLEGIELCDDGNTEDGDGCSATCEKEEVIIIDIPISGANETTIGSNETAVSNSSQFLPPLEPGQVAMGLSEIREVTINKGDKLLVEYSERSGELVVLRISKVNTIVSTLDTEIHTIRVDEINDNSVKVTVASDPVTTDIPIGGSETFEFGSGGTGGSETVTITQEGTQTRTCVDLNACGIDSSKPEEIQACIVGLELIYSPENLFLTLAPGTSVPFSLSVTDSGGSNLDVRWYVNGQFIEGTSGAGSINSDFLYTFNANSEVRVEVIIGGITEARTWVITINKNIDPECNENWYCHYSVCDGEFKYASDCEDLNSCGSDLEKPYKKACNCKPDYSCEEWGECNADLSLENVLKGEASIKGVESRVCEEATNCIDEEDLLTEERECNAGVPVRIQRVEWCYEDYIEIYDVETDQLVSRVKERSVENIKRVDIGFLTTENGAVCSYCFDGIKNFDETGVDCGGQICQVCVPSGSFFDYLYYSKFALWILLLMLTLYSAYRYRYELVDLPREAVWRIRTPQIGLPSVHLPSVHLPRFRLPHVHIEIGGGEVEPKRIERERLIPRERLEPKPYSEFRNKLRSWKKKGYYETSILESSLVSAIKNVRRSTRLARERRETEREERRRERNLVRERKRAEKERRKLQHEREIAAKGRRQMKFFSSLFSGMKDRNEERSRKIAREKYQRELERKRIEREKEEIRRKRELERDRIIRDKQRQRAEREHEYELEKRRREQKREERRKEREIARRHRREKIREFFSGIFVKGKKERMVVHQERKLKHENKGWFARMRDNSRRRKIERERRREELRRERERKTEERRREYERRREERIRAREEKVRDKSRKNSSDKGFFADFFVKRKEHKEKKRADKERKRVLFTFHRAEKRKAKKEMRHYKRKLRKKQISNAEASDLRRKLNEWKKKGYYGTTSIQKKLDKYEGRKPW